MRHEDSHGHTLFLATTSNMHSTQHSVSGMWWWGGGGDGHDMLPMLTSEAIALPQMGAEGGSCVCEYVFGDAG